MEIKKQKQSIPITFHKHLLIFFLIAYGIFGITNTLLAANYYVRSDGNDSNDGMQNSAANAFLTVQKCANVSQTGDICEVQPGIYDEVVTTKSNGISSAYITFQANGDVTIKKGFIINHNFIIVNGFKITNRPEGYNYQAGGINVVGTNNIISNNIISNPSHSIEQRGIRSFNGASENIYRNNDISGQHHNAVTLGGNYELFENNVIHDTDDSDIIFLWGEGNIIRGNHVYNASNTKTYNSGNHCDLFQTWGPATSKNHIIENNFVHDLSTQFFMCEDNWSDISNWTFRNNIFANVSSVGGQSLPGLKVYNNVFYNCAKNTAGPIAGGCGNRGCMSNADIKNNAFIGCGSSDSNGWYHFSNPPNKGAWMANTNYDLGDVVSATSPNGIHVYRVVKSGISGSSEPEWGSFFVRQAILTKGDKLIECDTNGFKTTGVQFYGDPASRKIFQNRDEIDSIVDGNHFLSYFAPQDSGIETLHIFNTFAYSGGYGYVGRDVEVSGSAISGSDYITVDSVDGIKIGQYIVGCYIGVYGTNNPRTVASIDPVLKRVYLDGGVKPNSSCSSCTFYFYETVSDGTILWIRQQGGIGNTADNNYVAKLDYTPKAGFPVAGFDMHGISGGDPGFINEAEYNFRLKDVNSLLIDKGYDLSSSWFNAKDIDEIIRPQGSAWDIGAYEYTGADIMPPAAPSGMDVK